VPRSGLYETSVKPWTLAPCERASANQVLATRRAPRRAAPAREGVTSAASRCAARRAVRRGAHAQTCAATLDRLVVAAADRLWRGGARNYVQQDPPEWLRL